MYFQRILPTLWVVGSICAFLTMQVFIKLLSADVPTQYIVCLRSVLLLIINTFFLFSSNEYQPYTLPLEKPEGIKYFRLNIKDRKLFILMMKRLFWNALSINCVINSLKKLDISIANTLLNTSPVITFFVEVFFYKKSIKCMNLAISVVCFIGVLAILNPFKSIAEHTDFNWYLVLPLVGAFSDCLNCIYLHQMRGQFKQTVVLEYAYVSHLLSSSFLMSVMGQSKSPEYANNNIYFQFHFYFYVCGLVFFAYSSHYLRVKATFKKKPSQILAFNYIGIIYSILIDFFFFHHTMEWITVVGVLLTSFGLFSKLMMDLFQMEQ